jgi:Ohr subfamily peroxiredoxin
LKYIQPPTTDHPMTVRGKRTMRIFWQSFVDASVNAPYMALLSPAIAGRAGPSSVSRERHMMTPEKVLYETEVTATGGRDGKAASADGLLSVSLSLPKSLGGRGDEGTNPEQLFAAGYAACFLGAVKLVARTRKIVPSGEPSVTAKVAMGPLPVGYAARRRTEGQPAWCREVGGGSGCRRRA